MPQPSVVLIHPPESESAATRIADQLLKLGYPVQRAGADVKRARAAKIETAGRVVVLWSRAARGTPALRAAVRRARARGTLVCVALDAAPPPGGAKYVARLPRNGAAWRGALSEKKRPLQAQKMARALSRPQRARRTTNGDGSVEATANHVAPRSAPILGFLATILVFGAAVGAGLYQTDPGFAAKVNALTAQAQAQVASLTHHGSH